VVGQASTTQTSVASLQEGISDTGSFMNRDKQFNAIAQQYQVIAYNNLVYLIRVVSNATPLEQVGKTGVNTGLLIDTFVPSSSGNLMLAQGARYKRSGLQFFGSNYTPTTMVDSIDTLDFTSITNETFYAPTIFIPIPEIDSTQKLRRRPVELSRTAVVDLHLLRDRCPARRYGQRRRLSQRLQP